MKRIVLTECIIGLLMLLFVYTGGSKLWDMKGFVISMERQPFAGWMNRALAYGLPWLELIVAAGLIFNRTRTAALYGYALMMCCFTVYTALVVFDFFEHKPCGCGGIVSKLNWEGHLVLNTLFLLLSVAGIYLTKRNKIFMHKRGVS